MALEQILCALYVALSEAAGGAQAKRIADRVILNAIADGSVDDADAIEFLRSLVCDGGDGRGDPELTPTSVGIH
jgi:hypothetical protein